MGSPLKHCRTLTDQFRTHWQSSTADNNLMLHGFRRFKTSHLLNLRFLESKIAELDRRIYQAGLSLDSALSPRDRLGLRYVTKDKDTPEPDKVIDESLILRMRDLLRQYDLTLEYNDSRLHYSMSELTAQDLDAALAAFKNVMAMETCSLLDGDFNSSLYNNLSLDEIYQTRLVRVDLSPRSRQDPFQRRIHKYLRALRYWKLSRRCYSDREKQSVCGSVPKDGISRQDTILVAEVLARLSMAIVTALFLVVPLVVLSYQPGKTTQLAIISVCLILFSSLVSLLLKVSNLEMMMVSAAYGAILSVIVSNTT